MFKRRLTENSVNRRNIINLLNWRFFAFAIVSIIAIGIIAVPAQQLISQNFRINNLQSELQEYKTVIVDLQTEKDRWKDPAYVKAQVRQRIQYVMPNEVGYIVLESEDVGAAINYKLGSPIPPDPWFRVILESLQTAGETANITTEEIND
jgi:cell division protein FtsB